MYKYTSDTIIMHICIVIIARAFNILVFFGSVGFVKERGNE